MKDQTLEILTVAIGANTLAAIIAILASNVKKASIHCGDMFTVDFSNNTGDTPLGDQGNRPCSTSPQSDVKD